MLRKKSIHSQHKMLCIWRDICTVHPTSCKSKLRLMLWMAHSYNVKNSTYPLRSHSRKWLENRMKMFLLAWKGLLAAGEQEKPEPSSVSEIACHRGDAGQPLTPLLALDGDMGTIHANMQMQMHFRKVRKNYCMWEFRGRISAVAGRSGSSSAKTPPYSTEFLERKGFRPVGWKNES